LWYPGCYAGETRRHNPFTWEDTRRQHMARAEIGPTRAPSRGWGPGTPRKPPYIRLGGSVCQVSSNPADGLSDDKRHG